MGVLDALLAGLLFHAACVGAPTVNGTVLANHDNSNSSTTIVPSAASMASCPKSCGGKTFDYPFGIGVGCFRSPEFELICNTGGLYLSDNDTEVLLDINVSPQQDISTFFRRYFHVISGVDVYNVSWKAPSIIRSFSLEVVIQGCGFDVYLGDDSAYSCTLTCPGETFPDVTSVVCNGIRGCCVKHLYGTNTMQLQFVRHTNGSFPKYREISVISRSMFLGWSVHADHPPCSDELRNDNNYACVSNNSSCDAEPIDENIYWYRCRCESEYAGNPYILDGCSHVDSAYYYNPVPRKVNCSRSCGDINVPFPFGLEESCSARTQFRLNCTDIATSTLQLDRNYQVSHIDIERGIIDIKLLVFYDIPIFELDHRVYSSFMTSESMHWTIDNLSCLQAQKNVSAYGCVSVNSMCLDFNDSTYKVYDVQEQWKYKNNGYRCQCMHGFHGNPYVPNGCQDIDECKTTPGICKELLCNNTVGSYHCTECPDKTKYDTATMQCIKVKRQRGLLLGIVMGLSAGIAILLLTLSAIFLVRKWRRDVQKRLRKKHFQDNQGLLLEQLISSEENAKDMTKIFSLEELEKSTNNFDHTRILGRGGHGMVYKGILSDQRVVAIKKSVIIQQSEIKQFINEVAILSQINHRNIVKLFGCCLETEVPLLVYDFIPNGSLFQALHSASDSNFTLSWDDCMRIACEAAGALCYLHSAAAVSVFHRDVKSSNILLDANYTAKVSDFGASRLVPIDQTHIDTKVQGTFGYIDPEYYQTTQLNEKSDVYSFGMVLLELLLRKEPIFTDEFGSKQNLFNYFLSELKSRPITEIVDAHIREEATEQEIKSVASLAEMCLKLRGEERPTMKQVEITLHNLRMERLNSLCQVARGNNQEIQPFIYSRANGGDYCCYPCTHVHV
uniref:Protein kinase domain-containing protein n=1 Tax=Setaria italica TaxID=4555 RepID=K4A0X6_SETIT